MLVFGAWGFGCKGFNGSGALGLVVWWFRGLEFQVRQYQKQNVTDLIDCVIAEGTDDSNKLQRTTDELNTSLT